MWHTDPRLPALHPLVMLTNCTNSDQGWGICVGAWGFPSIILTGQVLVPSLSCQPASASTLFHHVLMEQEGETSEGSHGSYPTLSQGAGECANRHPCPGWAKTTSAFFHLKITRLKKKIIFGKGKATTLCPQSGKNLVFYILLGHNCYLPDLQSLCW